MLDSIGKAAQQAAYQLATLNDSVKNQVLAWVASGLQRQQEIILQANQHDMQAAQQAGLSAALQDRLLLTSSRLAAMIQDVRQVMQLPDPVGTLIEQRVLENGLHLTRRRVPIGVIGVIYEARPNVTIDVVALAIKSGNALILRGGKETQHTNQALLAVIQQALVQSGLPRSAVQAINDPDRRWVAALLRLDRYVDLIIPRGGTALQRLCREQSTIPVISGGVGVCHLFVDACADQMQALRIINNAKVQRPSACNALETLLIHQTVAASILPLISADLARSGVILHACEQAAKWLRFGPAQVVAIDNEDYQREWLSLDLNIKVVSDLTEAIEHIRCYGTQHSEGIITQSESNAACFTYSVNAAVVYVNASTRFTDGSQFGLGAEVAISTQKLHARGPVGLEALTTYQWVAKGDHLIRS